MIDLLRSMLEIDLKRRPHVLEVEYRLAGILARTPGSSYFHRLQDAVAEATETKCLGESDTSFAASDNDQSGTQSLDTDGLTSEEASFQVRAKWQTRRMYRFFLQGLEPEPLHDEIVTTIGKYNRSKDNFRSRGGRNHARATVLQQAILRSLSFPNMRARERNKPVAHEWTFAWVFEDPHSLFLEWLNGNGNGNDEGGFWIKGKAWSGKSTLMNHIARNQEQRHISGALNGGSP